MGLVAMVVVWFLILFVSLVVTMGYGWNGGLVAMGLILAMCFGCNMAFLKCVMIYMNFTKMAPFFFLRKDRGEGKVVSVIINGWSP